MTKCLEETLEYIKEKFGNREFTIDEAILIRRTYYNLNRLVKEGKLKRRLSNQGGINNFRYKLVENKATEQA